jgi:hypothetical protein
VTIDLHCAFTPQVDVPSCSKQDRSASYHPSSVCTNSTISLLERGRSACSIVHSSRDPPVLGIGLPQVLGHFLDGGRRRKQLIFQSVGSVLEGSRPRVVVVVLLLLLLGLGSSSLLLPALGSCHFASLGRRHDFVLLLGRRGVGIASFAVRRRRCGRPLLGSTAAAATRTCHGFFVVGVVVVFDRFRLSFHMDAHD